MAEPISSNLSPTMRRILAAAALSVCAGAVLLPAAAQQQNEPQITVGVQLVLLEVTVKNKGGQVMDGLDKNDFIVREDGAEQRVATFSRDELPLDVALVVDTSASIRPFFSQLQGATASALRALKPDDSVSLFTFSSQVEQRTALTKDRKAIGGQLEQLTMGGSTNINGAMAEAAVALVRESPDGRHVIILVSDNVATDNGGIGPIDVTDRVVASGATVYSLKVPGENPLSDRVIAKTIKGLINVPKLVELTGGEVFDVEKMGSLDAAFSALIQRIKTRYTLGYYPGHANANQLVHKVDVQLVASFGKKGLNYDVLTRSQYYAAPSAH
jgi:Ca-activated chloride channel family protein